MEAVMTTLSYLFMALLGSLIPSSLLGVWVHNCKSFSNLDKVDKIYMLLSMWLIIAAVGFLYIYANLDTVNHLLSHF